MPYEELHIVGHTEVAPLFDETDDCHVYLALSGTPSAAWQKIFQGSDAELIQDRTELTGPVIRLRTNGRVIDQDMERLAGIVASVNSKFKEVHKTALRSQELIEDFLGDNLA